MNNYKSTATRKERREFRKALKLMDKNFQTKHKKAGTIFGLKYSFQEGFCLLDDSLWDYLDNSGKDCKILHDFQNAVGVVIRSYKKTYLPSNLICQKYGVTYWLNHYGLGDSEETLRIDWRLRRYWLNHWVEHGVALSGDQIPDSIFK